MLSVCVETIFERLTDAKKLSVTYYYILLPHPLYPMIINSAQYGSNSCKHTFLMLIYKDNYNGRLIKYSFHILGLLMHL